MSDQNNIQHEAEGPVEIWLGMKYFLIYWLKHGSNHEIFTREADAWEKIEELKKNPDLEAFELYETNLSKRWDLYDYRGDKKAAIENLNSITR